MGERVELFRRKLEGDSCNLLFCFSLAQALFDEGEFSEAEETFRLCLEEKQDWMLALLFPGRCLSSLCSCFALLSWWHSPLRSFPQRARNSVFALYKFFA